MPCLEKQGAQVFLRSRRMFYNRRFKIYLAIVISFSKYPAPPNLSIMNNV